MNGFEIAQLNVGRAVAPLEDAVMADFMNWLDGINALAERSPGFVWRLKGDNGNNTSLKVSDDPLFIVNLSIWSSIDALYDFTYRSDHDGVQATPRVVRTAGSAEYRAVVAAGRQRAVG